MLRLAIVVGCAVVSATGVVHAESVKLGSLEIASPCSAAPSLVGEGDAQRVEITCDNARLAVQVGAFPAKQFVEAALASAKETERAVQKQQMGNFPAVLGTARLNGNFFAVLAIEKVAGGQSVAFAVATPPANAAAGGDLLKALIGSTLKTLAQQTQPAEPYGGDAGATAATAATGELRRPTPKPAKGKKIPFTIPTARVVSVSPNESDFRFERDRYGNLAMLVTASLSLTKLAKEIFAFDKSGRLQSTGVTIEQIQPVLWRDDDIGDTFDDMEGDAEGNLYITITLHTNNTMYPVLATVRRATGKIEPVVTLDTVLALGDGTDWGAIDTYYRAAPTGEVWAFVKQGQKPTLRVAVISRGANGTWTPKEIKLPASLRDGAGSIVSKGTADLDGNFVFYAKNVLYRLGKDGSLVALAKVPEVKDVTVARPMVTPDGAIWLVASMVSEVNQTILHNTNPNPNMVDVISTVYVGGETRLYRFLPDGKGSADIGYIDGDDILKSFRKAMPKLESGDIIKFPEVAVDWSTGGLVLFDTVKEVLCTVVPGS